MLAVLAARLPSRHPVGTRCLDSPGLEGIARGQELPADGDLDVPMLGIPLAFLGRIDVEVLPGESLRIERRLRIVHTKSLGRMPARSPQVKPDATLISGVSPWYRATPLPGVWG